MRIEGSSISCGVRRLIVENNDQPTKDELVSLIKANHSCAVVVAGIPTRRRNVTGLLLENGFEQVVNPAKINTVVEVLDNSINAKFSDLASLMRHDHEPDDLDIPMKFQQFVEGTVKNDLTDFTSLVMHHGNELVGNLSFFIYYMSK